MNPQFLIAKLAASPTDTAWAQAYSTLNFYVVLSISVSENHDKSVAAIGKDALERLQREYFSLDDKSLENIKKAVQASIETIDTDASYSLVLATNVLDTLYIVTASLGQVVIHRQGKLGVIAKGETGNVIGFSGILQNGDIALIQTGEFAHKISLEELKPLITSPNVTEISENTAPLLQGDANGAEAVILLQYVVPEESLTTPIIEDESVAETAPEPTEKESEPVETDTVLDTPNLDASNTETPEEPVIETKPEHQNPFMVSPDEIEAETKKRVRPSPLTVVSFLTNHKKIVLGIGIFILVGILLGSILTQTQRKDNQEATNAINKAIETANAEYEEGIALEDLNRPLALEKFTNAQKILQDTKAKYPTSEDTAKINELLAKVDQKAGGATSGQKVTTGKKLLSASEAKLKNFASLTWNADLFAASDNAGSIAILSQDGDVDDTYTIEGDSLLSVAANDEFVFALFSDRIIRVDGGSGDDTELVELDSALQDIAVFGSNLYTVNSKDSVIEKRAPSSYGASSYTQDDLALTPVSLAIDGSVFALFEDGSIKKYTRGVEDTFTLAGARGKINSKGKLFTLEDFSNLYVLDQTNQRILAISKNGEVKQEYAWDVLKDAQDFVVDEVNKTIYVVTKDSLYSFTF